jgi:hypothetical protein
MYPPFALGGATDTSTMAAQTIYWAYIGSALKAFTPTQLFAPVSGGGTFSPGQICTASSPNHPLNTPSPGSFTVIEALSISLPPAAFAYAATKPSISIPAGTHLWVGLMLSPGGSFPTIFATQNPTGSAFFRVTTGVSTAISAGAVFTTAVATPDTHGVIAGGVIF